MQPIKIVALTTTLAAALVALALPERAASEPQIGLARQSRVVALINEITFKGSPRAEVDASEVSVIRAKDKRSEPGRTAQALYPGDEIKTGGNARVIISFLNAQAEKNNRAIIYSDSWIRILGKDSIFDKIGKIFINVRGTFDSKTTYVKMGAQGTEFEITVSKGGDTELVVIEGTVAAQRGDFSSLETSEGEQAGGETVKGEILNVSKRQEMVVSKGADLPKAPQPTTGKKVRDVLAWTGEVILSTQPTYPAENMLPYFETRGQRSEAFTKFRFNAVWKEDPGSYEALGDVYSDWGEAPNALEAYRHAERINPSLRESASFHVRLAEAHRMAGQIDEADKEVAEAIRISPQYAPALNVRGNVYMYQADIAYDRQDEEQARKLLGNARSDYTRSLQLLKEQNATALHRSVVQTNLGEVYLSLGNIALQQREDDEALKQYSKASRAFSAARDLFSQYPFAIIGSGRVYLGRGRIAESRHTSGSADFEKAESEFRVAISNYKDLAEAYVGLGNLYHNRGTEYTKGAFRFYHEAIRANPMYPMAYYYLGLLEESRNGNQAAEYFQTFLEAEPPAFRQGVMVSRAEDGAMLYVVVPDLKSLKEQQAAQALVMKGLKLGKVKVLDDTEERTIIAHFPKANTRVPPGSAVDIVVGSPVKMIRIPDLIGLNLEEAIRVIEESGFKAGIITRAKSLKSPGTVLEQKPKPQDKALPGTAVNLVIAVSET